VATLRFLLALIAGIVGILLSVPIILVGLPFAAVATLTRTIAHVLEPQFLTWGELIEFDPRIGWRSRANLDTNHLTDDVFHVTTDGQGWRGNRSIAESKIVVFGDSFAWGYGMDDEHFFANLNPILGIKAIGAVGYNMVQELLCLQQLSSQVRGKLVVWLIYYGNDLYDNLVPDMCSYKTPFVRQVDGTRDWEIITSHISQTRWPYKTDLRTYGWNYYQKLAELCSLTFLSQRAYAACDFLIRRAKNICTDKGAKLVVMTIPEITQLTEAGLKRLVSLSPSPESLDQNFPDQKIAAICTRLGVPFVGLKDHLEMSHYKTGDCHWNQQGHRRVAEVLAGLYHEHILIGKRQEPA